MDPSERRRTVGGALGLLAPPDVDGVTANLRGMLSLAEEEPHTGPEDWGILKDFLGFRLPQERDPEGHRSPPCHGGPAFFRHPEGTPPSAPEVPPGPLPSITTLVRHAPVDLSAMKTFDGRGPRPAAGSAFRTVASPGLPPQPQGSPGDALPLPCDLDRAAQGTQKPPASLLRDLLVLGKPARPQGGTPDQVGNWGAPSFLVGGPEGRWGPIRTDLGREGLFIDRFRGFVAALVVSAARMAMTSRLQHESFLARF